VFYGHNHHPTAGLANNACTFGPTSTFGPTVPPDYRYPVRRSDGRPFRGPAPVGWDYDNPPPIHNGIGYSTTGGNPNNQHRPRGPSAVDPDNPNAPWHVCRCGRLTRSIVCSCDLPALPETQFYCMCPAATVRGRVCPKIMYIQENVVECDWCNSYEDDCGPSCPDDCCDVHLVCDVDHDGSCCTPP